MARGWSREPLRATPLQASPAATSCHASQPLIDWRAAYAAFSVVDCCFKRAFLRRSAAARQRRQSRPVFPGFSPGR